MCGITGIVDLKGKREIPRALLSRMNQTQAHRGPDADGLHLEPGVGLGHRRLSIIDLATGQQPLFNEDGSVVVVFNGEIYNYQTLIPELTALGHVFRTKSDTEVIVHAWEAWGEACVERKQQWNHGITERGACDQEAKHRIDHAEDDGVARDGLEIFPADLQRPMQVGKTDGADFRRGLGGLRL